MAAAVVNALVPLAPGIFDLIAGLVHRKAPEAQAALGAGTGPVKFADVFTGVMNDLAKAHAAGQLPGPIPDDATVKLIIQAIVSSMNLLGLLDGIPAVLTAPASSSQAIMIKPGQILTITVGA